MNASDIIALQSVALVVGYGCALLFLVAVYDGTQLRLGARLVAYIRRRTAITFCLQFDEKHAEGERLIKHWQRPDKPLNWRR